jgi:hypothetical protein
VAGPNGIMDLNKFEKILLDFIKKNPYSPMLDVIAFHTKINKRTALYNLNRLVNKGILKKDYWVRMRFENGKYYRCTINKIFKNV